MLDQLSDTDLAQRPKPAKEPTEVQDAVRHVTQTDLEAYAGGKLPASRMDFCRTHLEACEACRAELEDIRTYQSSLLGMQRSEPSRYEPQRRTRRRGSALPFVVSGAAVLVVAVSTVLWWKHRKPRTIQAAPVVAQSTATPPSAPIAQTITPPAPADTRTSDAKPATSAAIQHGKLPPPADASRTRERVPSAAQAGFALLGPFGKTIPETRPEFTWQALPGAIGYTVEIVDTGLHPVLHSPGLKATAWRPRHPLHPGETYFWQVTATLHGGTKVVASQPSLSETALRILMPKLPDDMEHFRQEHQDAHLTIGAAYAQAGMLAESAEELKKIPPSDPSYNMAQAMLKSLPPAEPPAAPPKSH